MRIGIVDIGSNTVRLVIYSINENKEYTKILDYKKMLQLLNFIKNKSLNSGGRRALYSTMKEYKDLSEVMSVDKFFCFATASIRYLKNKDQILSEIEKLTGIKVEILSGEQEATMGFYATSKVIELEDDGISIDVGGGSSEVVYYKDKKISKVYSLPIGSLSLYLKHVKNIYPTEEEIVNIKMDILDNLKVIKWIYGVSVKQLVGIGGSARAATRVVSELYDIPKLKEGESVEIKHILQLVDEGKLKTKDLEKITRTVVDRSTTIIPGSLIFSEIAKVVGADYLTLSRTGIREGYLLKKIGA